MKGILTNCYNGKESEVELEYEIEIGNDGRRIFQLINGVTGYESFYIKEGNAERMSEHGWLACIGTEGSWDRLFISGDEMKKVFEKEGVI